MGIDDLKKMKLHEVIQIDSKEENISANIVIIRVPNGWLYDVYCTSFGRSIQQFVPE